MNTFYIYSLGCKVNSYEIEAIKDDLLKKGYIQVDEESADYVIVNTCCVTNTAASKSRQKINSIHKNNPNASIIVMGCYVQGFEEEVKQIEGVKLLVGTKDRSKIKEYIDSLDEQLSLGYKEIVLTGIHTGSYGKDLSDYTFTDLVKDLLKLDDLYRLRISSIEESEITDELIDLLNTNEKLAKHLHIPLQAGSDHVLKLMNRKYDLKTYIDKINYIYDNVKDIAITTDVIVGFPQESDEDFIDTINTCKQMKYSKIHVFPYSSRKGTVASKMSNQINGIIKKQRAKELLNLSNELGLAYNQQFLNKEVEVLIEEEVKGYYIGHTTNFIKVKVLSNKKIERNSIIKVKVKEVYDSYVIANMEE